MNRAEQIVWALLRDRRVADSKFRRQYVVGPYIIDFYSPELHLGLEVDGSCHEGDDARAYDRRRDAYLSKRGVTVLRISSENVRDYAAGVEDWIREKVEIARRRLK